MLQTPARNAPVRKAMLGACEAQIEHLAGGVMLVRNKFPLGAYPNRLTERFDHWARIAPDRVWLAARDQHGEWRKITYGEGRARIRRIAASLLTRNLSPERPIIVLSGNGLTHALFGTAALYAGIPYAPVSPAYSLISKDFSKLRGIVELLTPGMVFVEDARPFARAIDSVVAPGTELVVERNAPEGRAVTNLSSKIIRRPAGRSRHSPRWSRARTARRSTPLTARLHRIRSPNSSSPPVRPAYPKP
jgi:feruloyl-CoA synthase